MAQIDVSSAIRIKNNLLRTLLGQGAPNQTLRLTAPANDGSGGFTSIGSTTTDWYLKVETDAEGGQVNEVLKLVEQPTINEVVIRRATGCDIVNEDGSFERYTLKLRSPNANPISKEWTWVVQPNKKDKFELRP